MKQVIEPVIHPHVLARGVTWLSQKEEVIAHLFYAAAEIGGVQIDVGHSTHQAVLAFPHTLTETVDVLFQAPLEATPYGRAIRVRYYNDGHSYEFLTTVEQILDAQRWRLSLPRAVGRRSGRREDRFPTAHLPGYQLVLDREDGEAIRLQLYDVSTQGLSFVYSPLQTQLQKADQLSATLSLPNGRRLPVLLEVRYTRPDTGLRRIVGCHIIGISPSSRSSLAQSVAGLIVS